MNRQLRLLSVWCVILFSSCSTPKSVGASGTVTLDGDPLPEGTLLFEPRAADRGQLRQVKITNGKFDLPAAEGIEPGVEYRVIIKAFRKTGRKYPNKDMAMSYDEEIQYLPAEYNTATTLSATVSARESENQFKFELKSQAPAKK